MGLGGTGREPYALTVEGHPPGLYAVPSVQARSVLPGGSARSVSVCVATLAWDDGRVDKGMV
jgi:hypothetical protein